MISPPTKRNARSNGGPASRVSPISRDASAEVRALLAPYLDCLGPLDADGKPALYPGSPAIAQRLMRAQDRAIFCELRPDAFAALRSRFARDARIKTLHIDGYMGLGAYVPPKERRGLVLIDPPFERTDEFEAMYYAFRNSYEKWKTGIYALWHPSKDAYAAHKFYGWFGESGVRRALRLSLRRRRERRRIARRRNGDRQSAIRFAGRGALAARPFRRPTGAGRGRRL